MTRTDQPIVSRVVSRDGTKIGYWSSGQGRPLLLIHGGIGDHTRWDVLRPYLEPHFRVHAMDRRGRGASGDGPEYALEREYEDVAAVVDAIAEDSGSTVDVYCSSYGGLCAFGAAPLTSNIGKLALYEAWPVPDPAPLGPPAGFLERVEALLASGNREAAIEAGYRELLGLTEEQLDEVRAQPSWPARVAAAHTAPREIRAFQEITFDRSQAAKITVPTLLLTGSESPDVYHPEIVRDAMPDARIAVLEGQEHIADLLAPGIVAEQLLAFLRASRHLKGSDESNQPNRT
jgi:pimeloyl-ACP methyl ester carboxylesterase